MIERRAEHCAYLTFDHLSAVPGVAHAVFSRRGGFSTAPYAGLNLAAATGDDPARVARNRSAATAALGLPLVSVRATHSDRVTVLHREDIPRGTGGDERPWQERLRERLRQVHADALLTDVPGIALFWAFGDCAPVLLYDPRHRVIGLVHAGWRGTARAIVPRAIAAMRDSFGTRPDELLAGIGPAIGACCYTVGEEVRAAFAAEPLANDNACFVASPATDGTGPRWSLDVARSNERQLLAAGVAPEHLEMLGYCTGCRTDLFYSNRCEPKPSGRFGVALGLRGQPEGMV